MCIRDRGNAAQGALLRVHGGLPQLVGVHLAQALKAADVNFHVGEMCIRDRLYTEQKKFKAKMNYADKLGVPYVVFLGDDEIAAGLVCLLYTSRCV